MNPLRPRNSLTTMSRNPHGPPLASAPGPGNSDTCLSARLVQPMALIVCVAFAPACVIPPSLEEAPPSPNYSPAILRDDADFPIIPPPGPISPAGDNLVLDSIPVTDPDIEDLLTLRLLLDGIEVRTVDQPPTGDSLRVFQNVVIDRPCDLLLTLDYGQLVGVVSDRLFKGAGREVPVDAGTSSVEWVLQCP